MYPIGEGKALNLLKTFQNSFRKKIRIGFEVNALDCSECDSKGICCTDEKFVNVNITRLEAIAIGNELVQMPSDQFNSVVRKIEIAKEKIVSSGNVDFEATYSCPLFFEGNCLVHKTSKPISCIAHGCYSYPEELPPDTILNKAENSIGRLNSRVYKNAWNWLPLPIWLSRVLDSND